MCLIILKLEPSNKMIRLTNNARLHTEKCDQKAKVKSSQPQSEPANTKATSVLKATSTAKQKSDAVQAAGKKNNKPESTGLQARAYNRDQKTTNLQIAKDQELLRK